MTVKRTSECENLDNMKRSAKTISDSSAAKDPTVGSGPDRDQLTNLHDDIDRVSEQWDIERPDIDVSSMDIVSRIWRIGRFLERHREKNLAEWSTDRGTVDILSMLRRSGEPYRRTAGDLTKHSLITSGGVSQRLEKLERGGLVTRHVGTSDRRRVEVQLTDKGIELIDTVFGDVMVRENEQLSQALTSDERLMLGILLRKLLVSLEP